MDGESVWHGIEGIVLDAVGTLIRPRPSVASAYVAAASRQGVILEESEVRARFQRHFRDDEADEILGPMLTNETLELRRWRRIVATVLPEVGDPERAFGELWKHFASAEAWCCFDDVVPALFAWRSLGYRIAVASNFDGRLRGIIAGLPPLSEWSDALIISSEIGIRKPHPRFYVAACEFLGLDASRVLFIGDDPENDVAGAIRAGSRAVWIDRERRGGGAKSFPDLVKLGNQGGGIR